MAFHHYLATGLSALVAVGANAAAAQSTQGQAAAPSESVGLEDIVVTARRVAENLQAVPVSVTALSGDMITQRSITNLTDVGKVVPNLFIREGPQDPTTAFITIRGQAQPDSLITIDTAVGLYVDGVNYPRSFGMKANMVDIERVEVLRGPQGTLYGKNTTGGAFSVITRSPSDELGASIKANVGNYASYGATAVLNVPLADMAAIRIVGSFAERDNGFGENAVGHELGTESSRFLRGKLLLKPTETLSLLFSADYQRYRAGGPSVNLGGTVTPGLGAISYGLEKGLLTFADTGLVPGQPANGAKIAAAAAAFQTEARVGSFYDSNGTFDTGSRFKAHGFSLDINWEVSDSTDIRSITSYRRYERDTQYDFDLTSAAVLHPHTITPFDRNVTQELQLLGHYQDVDYVIGLYGSDEKGSDGSETFNLSALTGRALNKQDATIISQSLGVFGQATWRFADGWSLTGGLRYTTERKRMTTRNRNISPAGVITCNVPVALRDDGVTCAGTIDSTFSKPSWLISIDHRFDNDMLVYGKVSRGFRGGGQNLRGSGTVESFQPFRPEIVTEYEVGFKSEFFDRRLRLNGAAYYSDLSGVQRSVLVAVGTTATATVITNAASARLYGGELEATLRATDHLTLSGAVSYNNAKYQQFVDFTGDRSSEDWPTPDWQFNASANYRVPVAIGELSAQLDYYRQSSFNTSPQSKRRNEVVQKPYGLLNGRLALSVDSLNADVALYGRNLTAKKYYTTAVGLEALGYNIVFAGEPRTFGLEVTMRFGGERR